MWRRQKTQPHKLPRTALRITRRTQSVRWAAPLALSYCCTLSQAWIVEECTHLLCSHYSYFSRPRASRCPARCQFLILGRAQLAASVLLSFASQDFIFFCSLGLAQLSFVRTPPSAPTLHCFGLWEARFSAPSFPLPAAACHVLNHQAVHVIEIVFDESTLAL